MKLGQSTLTKSRMLLTIRHYAFRQAQCYLRPSKTSNRQQLSAFARLLSSLAVLEQREGKLQSASLSAVTAAQKLGGSITGFIAGSGIRSVVEEAAKVEGVEKIVMVENSAYDKVRSLRRIQFGLPMIASNLFSGSPRELCSSACRKHKERRIYTCVCWAFGFWQESDAQGICPPGCTTNIRHHCY